MSNTSEKYVEPKRKIILRVDEDDLPEIRNWEVGKKYKLQMTVKQISKSEGDPYPSLWDEKNKKKPKMECSFEVIEVEPLDEDEEDGNMDKATKKRVKEIGEKRYA